MSINGELHNINIELNATYSSFIEICLHGPN